jgi:aminoglycoside phosphotransferase family enzyme
MLNAALPGLEAKVAFLRQAASYPGSVYRVDAVETHMSWVFLIEQYVYKLKKPVCHELMDFRTLDARHYFCNEELRLNRRLAPNVYLEVVALTLDQQANLALGGPGMAVDWLVKMRRLPATKMFDYAILRRALSRHDLSRLGERLTEFYLSLPPETIDRASYRERLRQRVEGNLQELSLDAYRLPRTKVQTICRAQLRALQQLAGHVDDRVSGGRIVEGHGDLRPEHICLAPDLAIIDCLEFSRALRIVDIADELGFLALECERLGAPAVGRFLFASYSTLSGDTPPPALIHFYQSCRATTRAAIAVRHLREEKLRHSPHWVLRAKRYLQLAQEHIGSC